MIEWLALGASCVLSVFAWEDHAQRRRIQRQIDAVQLSPPIDTQSGLLTAEGLRVRLQAELSRTRRFGGTLLVLRWSVNDGDHALNVAADIIRQHAEPWMAGARTGPNTLAVLLPETGDVTHTNLLAAVSAAAGVTATSVIGFPTDLDDEVQFSRLATASIT